MLIRTDRWLCGDDTPASEITPQHILEQRRRFLAAAAMGAAGVTLAPQASREAFAANPPLAKLSGKPNPTYMTMEKVTPYNQVTTHNDFYEFGTDEADPARYADTLRPHSWQVNMEGLVKIPKIYDLDDLMKLTPMEERVYRLHHVEDWSMVIPWVGSPLAELTKWMEPQGSAKYIRFISLADRRQMPDISSSALDWPYSEGLQLDEAMHPSALLTFGLYGQALPNQNGAPVCMVLPWKYSFKSARPIVKIRFVDRQPPTGWNLAAANEHGFYSNVNPTVGHPHWSQATERRIGEDKGGFGGLSTPRHKTLMFNGYEQVAPLYAGMDLHKNF